MPQDELPALSEAQLEIMNVIWERGEATLGQVYSALANHRDVASNTIQTLMSRLVEKGWLRYRVEGKTHHYSATRPREATQRTMVNRMVDTVFGGSTEGLVLALLEARGIRGDEAARIRALIEQAESVDGSEEDRRS
jgi:BlaI family penicillinase repressor